MTTATRKDITLDDAIAQVRAQLVTVATGSCLPNNRHWEREQWIATAGDVLAELDAATDTEAKMVVVRRRLNMLANMGLGRAGVSTPWAHYACLIASGVRFAYCDGVLSESTCRKHANA